MLFESLESLDLHRVVVVSDPPSGLRAIIAIHDTTLGPAAGGVRTHRYPEEWAALHEAAALARTMTLKCALAGLMCGGGKAVVLDHDGLDRQRAFEILGAAVESLGGLFRTAGDLGTDEADLRAMERRTRFVALDAQGLDLEGATARGVIFAMREGVRRLGSEDLSGLEVLVQGAGSIGGALVPALVAQHANVIVADTDPERCAAMVESYGVRVVPAEDALRTRCDVFAPCAVGGVIDEAIAKTIPCKLICGSANNVLANDAVAAVLDARGVVYVPDFVANAGAVIEGMGHSVMELEDPGPLVERIGETTRQVLDLALERSITSVEAARTLAQQRIDEAMPKWLRSG